MIRAFNTYGRGPSLIRWWDDVATEARGRGFEARDLLELGTRAAWFRKGWVR